MQIQVKIIIGTIAFMLTMVLMGFVALREPARLRATTAAEQARKIENGAATYDANCVTCHGVNGMGTNGGECYDGAGEPIACVGRQLNNFDLVCGTRPARLDEMSWAGSSYDFINSTLTTGRPWANMPTWGEENGGPLTYNQIDDLTEYILNWGSPELCEGPAPERFVWPATIGELAAEFTGDADAGAELYVSQGCAGCHGNLEDPASAGAFPWLGDIADVAGDRLPGYASGDYVYESILLVNDYISPSWGVCDGLSEADCQANISGMNAAYPSQLNGQQMVDVMAYILGTSDFETNDVEIGVDEVNPEQPAEANEEASAGQ